MSWGIGTVVGPAVGGAFAESPATWRWVSWPYLHTFSLTDLGFLRPFISTLSSEHYSRLSTFSYCRPMIPNPKLLLQCVLARSTGLERYFALAHLLALLWALTLVEYSGAGAVVPLSRFLWSRVCCSSFSAFNKPFLYFVARRHDCFLFISSNAARLWFYSSSTVRFRISLLCSYFTETYTNGSIIF